MKTCRTCGKPKPPEAFAKDKRRSDGRGSYCKACENARSRALAAKNTATHTPPPAEGTKVCSTCGETKALTEFGRRTDSPTGFRSACRPCQRIADGEAMRRWRERNPELTLERARAWSAAHIEQERERWHRYDEANREKRRIAMAKRRAENPEYHRDLNRQWREANIEIARARCRAYWHRRRTGSAPSPEIDEYAEELIRQPCAYCGATERIGIDHIIPVSRGGKHVRENLAPACPSCNSSKGNKPLDEWTGPPHELTAAA